MVPKASDVAPSASGTTSPGAWQRQVRPERPQRQDTTKAAGAYRTLRGMGEYREMDEKELEKQNQAERVKYLKGSLGFVL
jgi:hypothetical protein